MWHDTWDSIGPLSSVISRRAVYEARLSDNTTVADMVVNGNWKWPDDWCNRFPRLTNIKVPVLNENERDTVKWSTLNGGLTKFAGNNIWVEWRVNNSTDVNWKKDCNFGFLK